MSRQIGNVIVVLMALTSFTACNSGSGATGLAIPSTNSGGASGSSATTTPPHVIRVSSGSGDACALYSNGTVACWGDENVSQTAHLAPATIPGISTATSISIENTACAVLSNGTVQCWNHWDGSDLATISGISDAVSVNAANGCALLSDGSVSCFYDSSGNVTAPTTVISSGVSALGVGSITGVLSGCAVGSGEIECWGPASSNQYGQLGLGSTDNNDHATPAVATLSLGAVTQVANGVGHTCTLNSSGQVYCFGYNDYGQLGAPLSDGYLTSATLAFSNTAQISLGSSTSCALVQSGGVYCWGYNPIANEGSDTPALVSGTTNVIQVSAGDQHVCALSSGGSVICWGENYFGQLGDDSTTASLTPVPVQGL